MRYYVISDIHGYYDEMIEALNKAGYFEEKKPHKLIICGDLFDRGRQAKKLQEFILDLMKKDEVILIKGNHEDLMLDLLNGWYCGSTLMHHHYTNGTIDTVLQLTETEIRMLFEDMEAVGRKLLTSSLIQEIIPSMINYYETEHYIFVHGWIPCKEIKGNGKEYSYLENWRNSEDKQWKNARWINGMEAASCGVTEEEKTIVCGHWHCSFGHSQYEHDGGEFDNNPNFSPYYGRGIIAIDGCTAFTRRVNCIVIED